MRARLFIVVLALEFLALTWVVIRDHRGGAVSAERRRNGRELAQTLLLTDLALWTEARYTRHPSQADWFTAFQDGPAAPDHFPAGTWVPPPRGGTDRSALLPAPR